jgi:hypothetical protein
MRCLVNFGSTWIEWSFAVFQTGSMHLSTIESRLEQTSKTRPEVDCGLSLSLSLSCLALKRVQTNGFIQFRFSFLFLSNVDQVLLMLSPFFVFITLVCLLKAGTFVERRPPSLFIGSFLN